MSMREVIDCDGCDKKNITPSSTPSLWCGSGRDATNASYNDYKVPVLRALIAKLSHDEQLEFAKKYPRAREQ
jgi:hypothetical protein